MVSAVIRDHVERPLKLCRVSIHCIISIVSHDAGMRSCDRFSHGIPDNEIRSEIFHLQLENSMKIFRTAYSLNSRISCSLAEIIGSFSVSTYSLHYKTSNAAAAL